ncbi:MAG TPA: YggS family pyridoxal phosphate-dependent enzyme [Phycisphaerales bacterium]|nr:YggS family pyridoxal phosphate-dependent enzyme [Phycisphaerales bacterium]
MAVGKAKIEKNLHRVRGEIAEACARTGRDAAAVRLVAVTKSADLAEVRSLIELGVTDLGESRAQDFLARTEEIAAWQQRRRAESPAEIRWHMIGHLQRNKVRHVLAEPGLELIHSVDSLRLAEEINARAEAAAKVVNVLMQVNCSNEPQKFGCAVGAALHLGELLCTLKHIRLAGLMTMAPLSDDSEDARPSFVRLRELFEEMRREGIGGAAFRHLSMGMSQDYAVAVEEGATLVRVGTALFA